jgi:16S rRNA (guanine966-N2)-methyltransferase
VLGDVEDARVLDLFAGSGALGIEALSRGAAGATFVDSAPAAVRAVRANVEALDLGDLVEVRRQDARTFLRTARKSNHEYDLVFLDPPYRLAAGIGRDLSPLLTGVLAPRARVVWESDRRDAPALDLPATHERRYGDTLIRIHVTE